MEAEQLRDWLAQRLVNDRAREEWRSLVEAGFERLLDEPLSALLPLDDVEGLMAKYLEPQRATEVARAQIRLGLFTLVKEARNDQQPLERWVSDSARARLMALVSREKMVDEQWIHQLFKQKAIEELVSDTLYRALRDFSTIVPRIVQSLTPKMVGKLAKLGGSVTGGVGSKVIEEVERRLEPEIRRFLEKGTQRALEGAARFAAQHMDDPVARESKRNMTSFVLQQSGAFHARPVDDAVLTEIEDLVSELGASIADREESREILRRVLVDIRDEHGAKPLRDWLASLGIEERPPYDEWAQLTWPGVVALLSAPGVRDWLLGLAEEVLEQVRGTDRNQLVD